MNKTTIPSTTTSQLADALRIVASTAFTVLKVVAWIVSIAAFAFLVTQIARSLGDYLVALDKIPAIALILGSCFFSFMMLASSEKIPLENKFRFFVKCFSIAFPLFMFGTGLYICHIASDREYLFLLSLISGTNLAFLLTISLA